MKINTPITDRSSEMVSTHRCNERMMVAADVARQLELENIRLKNALNLAKQHIAAEFGYDNWRIEQVDNVSKNLNTQ